jgi:hypothetical protein
LLHQHDYSLRTNRKLLAGTHHLDRDRQFRYLTRIRRWYLTHGLPVISVNTKKKELVGNFKNPGRCWQNTDRDVLDHDFARQARSGFGFPLPSLKFRTAGFPQYGFKWTVRSDLRRRPGA